MLIAKGWLEQFVEIPKDVSSAQLALDLTMKTVEVEGAQTEGKNLENIVVGEIKSIAVHPDADRLRVCMVKAGSSEVQVVCGGLNIKEGLKVALGKVGAKVRWHGEGDLVELKRTKIRGVESQGMICASDEIGLGEMFPKAEEKEILDLSAVEAAVGTPLAEALGLNEVVFDIDNKSMSHRPDLWGHYGLAREVAAIYGQPLAPYDPPSIKAAKEIKLNVEIKAAALCPRYMGVVVDKIKVEPSPAWLQQRLITVGLRPINNIVDITNFVLYELGQPMHAFDFDQLSTDHRQLTISVQRAGKNLKLITLDEKEHKLDKEMLVIANEGKAVALAGVMGGKNSGVSEATVTIVFESANFDATSVRKTALKLGMRTDSSARFEKSLDPNNCELALRRAVELTLQLCPGARVVSNVADMSNFNLNQGPIELALDFLHKKLGVQIEKQNVIEILKSLGFRVQSKKASLLVTVPTWRATKDISVSEDLVEEIARLYGYGNIPASLPSFPIEPPPENRLRDLERKVKELLVYEFGYTEVYNYSFVSKEWLDFLGEDTSKYLELDNPVAMDRPLVRRHIVPNMLVNIEANLHRFESVKLFEIGQTFMVEEAGVEVMPGSKARLPKQDRILGMAFAKKSESMPFYGVDDPIWGLLKSFHIRSILITSTKPDKSYLHPGRYAQIQVNGSVIGFVSELHPDIEDKLGLPSRVAVAELNLNRFIEVTDNRFTYRPIHVYPSVDRDVAFVVDRSVEHAEVVEMIKKVDSLIVDVQLFDVYADRELGERKKSMAYHIVYRSDKKTLEAGEVEQVHERVVEALKGKFKAKVRQ